MGLAADDLKKPATFDEVPEGAKSADRMTYASIAAIIGSVTA